MKVSLSQNIDKYIQGLQKKVDDLAKNSLNNVVDYASKQAEIGFERFMIEVPADDPIVFVTNTPLMNEGKNKYYREIKCVGNQVLFIEFGAGIHFYTETELRLYQNVMPINPRPTGLYNIGEYGQGRGKDDVWFYKSETGRESENAHWVRSNRNGDPIMVTHGNRPARVLYRSVGMAMRRLLGGKFK